MRHQINKLNFDLVHENEAMAKQAHTVIKDILSDKIIPAITAVLDEITVEGFVLEIDRLELDLGDLDLRFLEQQLKEKIYLLMSKTLKEKLQKVTDGNTDELTLSPKSEQQTAILLYFLQHGRLPWWADKEKTDLDGLLKELPQKNAATVKQFFAEIGQNEKTIRRLAIRFDATLVLRLITMAWVDRFPRIAEFLGQFNKNIRQFHPGKVQAGEQFLLFSSLFILQREQQAEKSVYQQITENFFRHYPLDISQQNRFTAILVQASSKQVKPELQHQYSDQEVLRHFLEYGSIPHWAQLEKRQSVLLLWKTTADKELADWIEGKPAVLKRIQQQIPLKIREDFLAILPKLQQERLKKAIQSAKEVKKEEKQRKMTSIDLLIFFLQEGHIPWWAAEIKEQDPRKILQHLLEKHPHSLLSELAVLRQDVAVKTRLLQQFSDEIFKLLIDKLQPTLAGFTDRLFAGFEHLIIEELLPKSLSRVLLEKASEVLLDLLLATYPKQLLPAKLTHLWVEELCEKLHLETAVFYHSLLQSCRQKEAVIFVPLLSIIEQRLATAFQEKQKTIVNPQKRDFEQAKRWKDAQKEILKAVGLQMVQKENAGFSTYSIIPESQYDGPTFYAKLSILAVENNALAQTFIRRLFQQPQAKKQLAQHWRQQDFFLVASIIDKQKAKQLALLLEELSASIQKALSVPPLAQAKSKSLSKTAFALFFRQELLAAMLYFKRENSIGILISTIEALVEYAQVEMGIFLQKLNAVLDKQPNKLRLPAKTLVEILRLKYSQKATATGEKTSEDNSNSNSEELELLFAENKINVELIYHKIKQWSKEKQEEVKVFILNLLKNETTKIKLAQQLNDKSFHLILGLWNSEFNKETNSITKDLFPFLKKELNWTENQFYIASKLLIFNNLSSNKFTNLNPKIVLQELIQNQIEQQRLSSQKIADSIAEFILNKKSIKIITKEFLLEFAAEIKIKTTTKSPPKSAEIQKQLLENIGLSEDLKIIGTFENSKLQELIIQLKKQHGLQVKSGLKLLLQDKNIRNYLVEKADDKVLDLIVAQWQTNLSPSIRKSIHDLFIPLKQALRHSSYTLERAYKANLLAVIIANEEQSNSNLVLEKVLEKILEQLALQRNSSLPKLARGLQALMNNDNNKYKEESLLLVENLVKTTKAVTIKKEIPKPLPKPLPKVRKRKKDVPKKPVEIAVNNAGLVILRPYLGMYFDRLGLDLEKKEDAHRAAHLLQYIAYKTTENAEEDLVLNKILCGIPLDEPIPGSITITENERILSEQIIKAATQNWPAMNNTENDNFRVTFLHRKGILKDIKTEWHLKVEWQTFDFLLETITWGFKMIMMKHMDKMLTVEWEQP